jgi:hypothetical protein
MRLSYVGAGLQRRVRAATTDYKYFSNPFSAEYSTDAS